MVYVIGNGDRPYFYFCFSRRYIDTANVSVPYGGLVKFKLKFGPRTNDARFDTCKPAFKGNVL